MRTQEPTYGTEPYATTTAPTVNGAPGRRFDRMRIIGRLTYGQYSREVATERGGRMYAIAFQGGPGDVVDAWVGSRYGDAVAFLLDDQLRVLARNDNAHGRTWDARVQATLPNTAGLRTYYVAFRDRTGGRAAFTVGLNGWRPQAGYVSPPPAYSRPIEPMSCSMGGNVQCRGASVCVDDPGDNCDARHSASCSSHCECRVVGACAPGYVWSYGTCGCEPAYQ